MSCDLRLLAAPALLVAISACTPVDRGFGEALKYDMAIQTIDPEPVYAEDGAKPGDDGAKAAAATKRYRTDAVKAVTIETTAAGGPN